MSSPILHKILRGRDRLWTGVDSLNLRLSKRMGKSLPAGLYYIIPEAEWVTDWVGRYITRELRRQYHLRASLTSAPESLSGQMIHYGEVGAFLHTLGQACNRKNIIISTIFHGVQDSQFPDLSLQTENFMQHAHVPRRIVTACKLMQGRLQDWGIPKEKITYIPLGIDLNKFFPAHPAVKEKIRRDLDIPSTSICIGSFQKDGVGWSEGLQPKFIKGPDIFLEVIQNLKSHIPIMVLLSGPARGYVKQGLEKIGVPYRHIKVKHYQDMCKLYHALDLYLVTSREEGGPLGVLESLATGIPIISSRVGLAPDLIQHEYNGFLVDIEAIQSFVEYSTRLIESQKLRSDFRKNGLESIQAYDWPFIASQYYKEVYFPLIQTL